MIGGVGCAAFSKQFYSLFVGIALEPACIVNQRFYTLTVLHFIEHGAFHFACDFYQTIVRTNHNDVVVCQFDVSFQFSVENIIVDVNGAHQLVFAIHLDVTQRSYIVGASRHIQCVKNGGKGR